MSRLLAGRRASLRRFFGLFALVATLLVLFVLPSSGFATARLGDSPHGEADSCGACHDLAVGPAPGAVRPIEVTCRSCHPDADMHPVGMRPKDIQVAEGWPLESGIVTCATCHAEPSCDPKRDRTPPFLRGGTPPRKMDFCYRCHASTALTRTSPHLPVASDGAANTTCSACHSGQPQAGAGPTESRLRLAPVDACVTCHPGPVHLGVSEHTGTAIKTPLTENAARLLPLLEGDRIACFTCHDVHNAYVGPRDAEGHNTMLALPANDGSLCRACHGNGP